MQIAKRGERHVPVHQRGGDDRAAGMQSARLVGVVERMNAPVQRIDESGAGRGQALSGTDDGRIGARAPAARRLTCRAAFGAFESGEHDADRIEHMALQLIAPTVRQPTPLHSRCKRREARSWSRSWSTPQTGVVRPEARTPPRTAFCGSDTSRLPWASTSAFAPAPITAVDSGSSTTAGPAIRCPGASA